MDLHQHLSPDAVKVSGLEREMPKQLARRLSAAPWAAVDAGLGDITAAVFGPRSP